MSNKTSKKEAGKSVTEKKPVGIKITQENWNTIMDELSVFKKTVVDSVVGVINKNSSPIFED